MLPDPIVRPLRAGDYLPTLAAMRDFTATRHDATPDEIWLIEHPPVFTQGLAGRAEHLLATGDIPVVKTERGGQVTYHGPGQVVAYLLLDLRRLGLTVKGLVCAIEDAVIAVLAARGVQAVRRTGAPGVYLRRPDGGDGPKIASLGIKVSRGCTYHGVALNVDMDLEPFGRIDPCGYPGQAVTDLRSALGLPRGALDLPAVAEAFARCLIDATRPPAGNRAADRDSSACVAPSAR